MFVRKPRILVVDDDQMARSAISVLFEQDGFDVVEAATVPAAIKLIADEPFDVLLSDMHMPDPGDGLTVVSAMRHVHPQAVAVILTAYPEMEQAAAAITRSPHDVLPKAIAPKELVETIQERLKRGPLPSRPIQSVATILQRETDSIIENWLSRVDVEPHVTLVSLPDRVRCAHLPQLFRDLIDRLRDPVPFGKRAKTSPAAAAHGLVRRQQGYSAAMLVEESRLLQVSIFEMLQNNLHSVDFSVLLLSIMAIADEVDSQLAQAMVSYISEANIDTLPSDGSSFVPRGSLRDQN